jgi:hypothetical protein
MMLLLKKWWKEPRHDKTNIVRLWPAWMQTSMRIRAVWSGSILFTISFSTCNRVGKPWSDCADAQAGLDPCWSQTHYVGFVMTRLKCFDRREVNISFSFSLSIRSWMQYMYCNFVSKYGRRKRYCLNQTKLLMEWFWYHLKADALKQSIP